MAVIKPNKQASQVATGANAAALKTDIDAKLTTIAALEYSAVTSTSSFGDGTNLYCVIFYEYYLNS